MKKSALSQVPKCVVCGRADLGSSGRCALCEDMRDEFAKAALPAEYVALMEVAKTGDLENTRKGKTTAQHLADESYKMADAMLEARKK